MLSKNDVVDFLQNMIGEYEKICATYNPSSQISKKSFDTPMGRLDLNRSEGETFDKATSIYCDLKIETPPVLAEELGQEGSTADAMVLEIHFFPVNPHIPKAYIELRANITDKVVLAGGTDIKPYFDNEEDIKYFADAMKELCARHGKKYDELQKVRADFFKSKYSGEKVGSHAGIYSFHLDAEDFGFYKDLGETYITLVKELVEKRKGQEYSKEDMEDKLKQHGEWVQWTLLEDDGTIFGLKKGIPAEALLGAILPPHAKF